MVARTPEVRFLKEMERLFGRPLTEQEDNVCIAQAVGIGDLPYRAPRDEGEAELMHPLGTGLRMFCSR